MTLQDFTQLVTALAAFVAAITSIIAVLRLHQLHVQLNSRLSELLAAAQAQGVVKERAAQDARDVVKSKRKPRS